MDIFGLMVLFGLIFLKVIRLKSLDLSISWRFLKIEIGRSLGMIRKINRINFRNIRNIRKLTKLRNLIKLRKLIRLIIKISIILLNKRNHRPEVKRLQAIVSKWKETILNSSRWDFLNEYTSKNKFLMVHITVSLTSQCWS